MAGRSEFGLSEQASLVMLSEYEVFSHGLSLSFKRTSPHITNCRVKRHLITTSSRQHGSPAETKPDSMICTHHPNTQRSKPNQGPKLYSKVLKIEPNRLLSKCSLLNKGA
jgi:hypothetical protein